MWASTLVYCLPVPQGPLELQGLLGLALAEGTMEESDDVGIIPEVSNKSTGQKVSNDVEGPQQRRQVY